MCYKRQVETDYIIKGPGVKSSKFQEIK